MTLDELAPGSSGVIAAVDTSHPAVVRLMVLGLVEGTPVTMRNRAIGGDPLEVTVMGSSISLRAEQASHFTITAS